MEYTNDKIKNLIEQRNKIDSEIEHEINKGRARYKFSWKRFALLTFCLVMPIVAYKVNVKLFPKNSIWSWKYYVKDK